MRLVVDAGFRDRAMASDAPFADVTDITPTERRRLAAVVDSDGLRITVLLHHGWRLGKLLTVLPRTCELLGPERAAAELKVFWRHRLPASLYFREEAAAFAEHLARQPDISADTLLSRVLSEERDTLGRVTSGGASVAGSH